MWNFLAVNWENVNKSLELMLKGMGGILVVMFLIFLVILVLNKCFNKKKDDNENDD